MSEHNTIDMQVRSRTHRGHRILVNITVVPSLIGSELTDDDIETIACKLLTKINNDVDAFVEEELK